MKGLILTISHIALISLLSVCTQQVILARELKANIADKTFDALVDTVAKFKSDTKPIQKNISTHETQFTFKKTGDPEITIKKEGGEVSLELKSGYEQASVTTENLDYEKEKGVIDNDFLTPYFDHLNQILDDEKKAFESFQEGVKEVKTPGYGVSTVQALPADTDKQINFQIQVTGEGMEDGVYGELSDDGKIFKLRLVTKYFQNEIILNIRTKNYVKIESKNVLTEMIQNMEKMIKLNENNSSSGEQVLENQNVFSSIETSMKRLTEEGSMVKDKTPTGAIFKLDGKPMVKIDIKDESVGGFAFTQVKATLDSLGGKIFVQNFLKNSLYNMSSMVDSYLEEITKFTLRSVNKENPEEYVPAFEVKASPKNRRLQLISNKTIIKTNL